MGNCAVASDGRTIIAGDVSGRMHFLQLVEADKTKMQLLQHSIRSKPDLQLIPEFHYKFR